MVGVSDNTGITGGNLQTAGGIAYTTETAAHGNFYIAGPPPAGLLQYTTGTVIAYAFDFGAQKVWTKAGCAGAWDNNFVTAGEDPATGVGGFPITGGGVDWNPSGTIYIGYSDFGSTTNAATINDGATAFACTVPSGFVKW